MFLVILQCQLHLYNCKKYHSNSLDVRCQKNIIDTAAGTQNYFFGGQVVGHLQLMFHLIRQVLELFQQVSLIQLILLVTMMLHSQVKFSARAVVEYCFYPLGNISDSTCNYTL